MEAREDSQTTTLPSVPAFGCGLIVTEAIELSETHGAVPERV